MTSTPTLVDVDLYAVNPDGLISDATPPTIWIRVSGTPGGMGDLPITLRGPRADVLGFVREQWGDDEADALLDEWQPKHYTPPKTLAGTVFDPRDDTFGPIMAAIQDGAFETARRLLALAAPLADDPRFCSDCGADIDGDDPHGPGCPKGEA